MSRNSSNSGFNMRLGTKVILGLVLIVVVVAILSSVYTSPDLPMEKNLMAFAFMFVVAIVAGALIVNSTVKQLNEVVETLKTTSDNITESSALASDSSHSLAEGSTEQAASVQETSATMEETSSLVEQTTQNTKEAVLLAENAKKEASSGLISVTELLGSMQELSKSSESVQKIIKVIDGIAFQTNILSLNAAVEAARVGDAGKGFAVVAEEVRNLAQRSAQAGKETAELIEGNVNLARTAANVSEDVGDELKRIDSSVARVKDLLDEISTASQEQVIATNQIAQAITQIDQGVQVQSGVATTSATDAKSLLSYCDRLRSIMEQLILLVRGSGKDKAQQKTKKIAVKKSSKPNRPGNTRKLENKTSNAPKLTSSKGKTTGKKARQEEKVEHKALDDNKKHLDGAKVVAPEDVIPLGDF